RCATGATQLGRVLRHVRAENEHASVTAVIVIGDAVEEFPGKLYDAAWACGVPTFMFQEGDGDVAYLDPRGEPAGEHLKVEQVFREIARITGGAYARFDAGAAAKLRELLQAVAAFCVGGMKALSNQHTESARRLLNQMK